MKIAVFSDVHANLPALEAVLADIADHGADQIYCLGDLVDFAPWNNEVINLLRNLEIPVVMGNHDERIAFDIPLLTLKKHNQEESEARIKAIEHTRRTILKENKDYLSRLPAELRLNFSLNNEPFNILLVHASPRSNDEYIYEDHDQTDLGQMFDSANADLIVGGHTHLSYIRSMNFEGKNRTVVNCGSVGRTKEGDKLACYLMISMDGGQVNYELRKIAYNIQETIAAIQQSEIPDFYADFLSK